MLNLSDLMTEIGHQQEIEAYLQRYQHVPAFALIEIATDVSFEMSDIQWFRELGMQPILILSNAQDIQTEETYPIQYQLSDPQLLPELAGSLTEKKIPIIHTPSNFLDPRYRQNILALLQQFQIQKYLILTQTGYIKNQADERLDFINLQDSVQTTLQHYDLDPNLEPLIQYLLDIVHVVPELGIVISSKTELLRELLTIKGSGTYIKYHDIDSSHTILDTQKVQTVIEAAFGKKLDPSYFKQAFTRIFFQKEYEAIAIIKIIQAVPYLDKFAVHPLSRGTGLAKSLWNDVITEYPKLVWRSSIKNPFNPFYFKHCDGSLKQDNWQIFWRGLTLKEATSLIDTVAKLRAYWL